MSFGTALFKVKEFTILQWLAADASAILEVELHRDGMWHTHDQMTGRDGTGNHAEVRHVFVCASTYIHTYIHNFI